MQRKGDQVFLEVGDVVRVTLPSSEACMHLRVAGKPTWIQVVGESEHPAVQLFRDDGSHYSFPILPGEAGVFTDGDRLYIPTSAVIDIRLRLFVPKPGSPIAARIDRGSAIVGTDTGAAHLLVDYEGNRLGAENLQRYWQRAEQAAGRHLDRYPTVARSLVPREELVPVGWWDKEQRGVTLDGPAEELVGWAEWVGLLGPAELQSNPPSQEGLPGRQGFTGNGTDGVGM